MALPEVRFYVWLIEKTERVGGSQSRTPRVPERVIDMFQMPADSLVSLSITDGIAEEDDTFQASFTDDNWPFFLYIQGIRNNRVTESYYPVMAVTVDNRLFGPYDLETPKFTGESRQISYFGRIDREFQDTVIDKYQDVFFSQSTLNTVLGLLLSETEPYKQWNSRSKGTLRNFIIGEVGGALELSGIRQALNPYNIGVSPQTLPYVVGGEVRLLRDIALYPLYPCMIRGAHPDNQLVPLAWLEVGFSEDDDIRSVVAHSVPRVVELDVDLWMDSPPSFEIPNQDNAPGAYQKRRIDMAIKNIWGDATLYSIGSQLPRAVIDPKSVSIDSVLKMELARWKLQNTSASASVKMAGNPYIVPRQFVILDVEHLIYPDWRITGVKHNINYESDGYSTELMLMLRQGLYTPPDDLPRAAETVATPTAMAVPVTNPDGDTTIPDNVTLDNVSWWRALIGF